MVGLVVTWVVVAKAVVVPKHKDFQKVTDHASWYLEILQRRVRIRVQGYQGTDTDGEGIGSFRHANDETRRLQIVRVVQYGRELRRDNVERCCTYEYGYILEKSGKGVIVIILNPSKI
jgi:hypothetical protein